MTVSMVSSCTATRTKDVKVRTLLEAIRKGRWRKQIEAIRSVFDSVLHKTGDRAKAKEAITSLKKKMPAVMLSGQFKQRANNALSQHSGIICADLDLLGTQLESVRMKVRASLHLFAMFLSPSGDGFKLLFKVPADLELHLDSFRAIAAHVLALTGIAIDESCKDVARLCFVSFDPDIYLNENAVLIAPLPPKPKPQSAQSSVPANLAVRQRIAVELMGAIEWDSEMHGFLKCPGQHLHTTSSAERDCEIHLDGSPTLHCFHDHCRGFLDGLNHELRSRIGKAERAESSIAADTRTPANEDDEAIVRLAALSPLEYERQRKAAAEKLQCRESVLDKLVNAERLLSRPPTDNLQGTAVKLPEIEPWPEPVNGAAVLNEISRRIAQLIVLRDGAADAITLWCAHAHCPQCSEVSPRLCVTSPEKGSGKTTTRDEVALFVPRPLPTENLTTAVLFRLVSAQSPTILADEYDLWLLANEELRGLLNAGHRKGAMVYRCEGDQNEVRGFAAYAPAMLCGIGNLPGTLLDRAIVIRLERAKKGEIQARFDQRHVEQETVLRRKLARFIADNRERLKACDPKLPDYLYNRSADNWRPLFAIAEIAGGDWLQRCADASRKLQTDATDDAETLRVMLLTDLQQVFAGMWPQPAEGEEPQPLERIFSKDLCEKLAEMKERPWPEVCRGKAVNERWLARNLGAFGIKSKSMRIGDANAKGYEAQDFESVFERYVGTQTPIPPFSERHTVTTPMKRTENDPSQTEDLVTDKKEPFTRECDVVTDETGGVGPNNTGKGYLEL
jgi:hypothetical protein